MAARGRNAGMVMPPKLSDDEETGRINVTAPMSFVRAVEEWRIRQRPVLTMAKAVRVLVEQALEAERKDSKRTKE